MQRDMTSAFYGGRGHTPAPLYHVTTLLIYLICIVGMTEDGAGIENLDQLEEAVLGSGHP